MKFFHLLEYKVWNFSLLQNPKYKRNFVCISRNNTISEQPGGAKVSVELRMSFHLICWWKRAEVAEKCELVNTHMILGILNL